MKRLLSFLPLFVTVACEDTLTLATDAVSVRGLTPSMLCSGHTVAGVTGTANCSDGAADASSITEDLYVFSARNDLPTQDWSDLLFLADLVSGSIDRSTSVLTLQSIYDNSSFINFFASKYTVIPNPVGDSDGRFRDSAENIGRKHYLERIVGRPDQECGTSGSISQRIAHCAQENGAKAFYDGVQYGGDGEGDWRLVTRLSTGEEVWRDERTKLLWSDRARGNPAAAINDISHPNNGGHYNWYQASGYAKNQATSQSETGYNAEPGQGTACNNGAGSIACQPSNPISVCAEVDPLTHKIIGGGADPLYDYQDNPETAFKGELKASDGVLWKLPSKNDFMLAEVNGIRKVLPFMDDVNDFMASLNTLPNNNGGSYFFWSSSSSSGYRLFAWYFGGSYGDFYGDDRSSGNRYLVRCIGLWRD